MFKYGDKSAVWRSEDRLKQGKKSRCQNSPTLKEEQLHDAIMKAINNVVENTGEFIGTFQENVIRVIGNSIMPGKYRKIKKPIPLLLKVDLIKPLTHLVDKDINTVIDDNLRIYYIQKPSRKIIAKINTDPHNIHEFYNMCEKTGAFGTLLSIKEGIFGPFGCWVTHPKFTHLIGVEVEPDYSDEVPDGMEFVNVAGSQYVVFHHDKHNSEFHEKVIKAVWKASENWNPHDHGMEWNFENAPTYEDDNDELGYFVYKPIRVKEFINITD